jgi:outer membrane biosynthesis protein TonB
LQVKHVDFKASDLNKPKAKQKKKQTNKQKQKKTKTKTKKTKKKQKNKKQKNKNKTKQKAGEMTQQLKELLFQRTWIQFPAPTWQLTTVCNSSSRGSGTLTQTHMPAKHQST